MNIQKSQARNCGANQGGRGGNCNNVRGITLPIFLQLAKSIKKEQSFSKLI